MSGKIDIGERPYVAAAWGDKEFFSRNFANLERAAAWARKKMPRDGFSQVTHRTTDEVLMKAESRSR
ncbi:MAG: hypothetical protein WC749_01870 [Dehalococcoidia bacterium]